MMKYLLLGLLAVVALSITVEAYSTKFDNVDADEILNNDRLYQKYFECLTDKGKCTPDGKYLKEVLPEALTTKCAKCNEKQKTMADKVINFLIEKKPADFTVVEKIYDPEGIYKATLPKKN